MWDSIWITLVALGCVCNAAAIMLLMQRIKRLEREVGQREQV